MKYLYNFHKFKLLLERINKDDDYYEGREDLHLPAEHFIKKLQKLDNILRQSDGVLVSDKNKTDELKRLIREIFFEVFDEALGFFSEQEKKVRQSIKNWVKVGKLHFEKTDTWSKEAYITYCLSDKGLPIDIGAQTKFRNTSSGINYYLVEIEREKKDDKIYFVGLKNLPSRIDVLKMIEEFSQWYYNENTRPEEKEAVKLLKSGKNIDYVVKTTKLSKEKVEDLKLELQEELEES